MIAGSTTAALEAWNGLLRVHRRLTRELEASLKDRHGLTLSALELLGRLADTDERRMRIARLAEQAGLSVSRTSRLIDTLEQRGLLAREPCPEDSRASNVHLRPAGLRLAREAQTSHLADLQRVFFDRLTPPQLSTLAATFAALAPHVQDRGEASHDSPPAGAGSSSATSRPPHREWRPSEVAPRG